MISSDGINTVSGVNTQEDNTGTGGTRTDFADDLTTDVKITSGFTGILEDRDDPATPELEPGDEDFVQVDLVANVRHTIRFSGLFTKQDPADLLAFHTLLAPYGAFLAQAENAGGEGESAAEITFIPEVSGTYSIAIRNPDHNVSSGNYSITVASSGVDTVTNVENVIGSDQDDDITGTAEINSLSGGRGRRYPKRERCE